MTEKIISNSVRCLHCDDIISSKHRHDYVGCGCGKTTVDGGLDYLRRGHTAMEGGAPGFVELSDYWRPTLTIVRGLPGTGKSTIARKLAEEKSCAYYEADMFFIQADGTYKFDPKYIGAAHQWCFSLVQMDIQNGRDVIVSNTFTIGKELEKYILLAQEYGYPQPTIITQMHEYGSIHNVPEDTMVKMRARFVYDVSEQVRRIYEN